MVASPYFADRFLASKKAETMVNSVDFKLHVSGDLEKEKIVKPIPIYKKNLTNVYITEKILGVLLVS